MSIIPAGEQGSAREHLREDASHRPDVDSLKCRQKKMSHRIQQTKYNKTHTFVYILNESMISGARYHLVATYSYLGEKIYEEERAKFSRQYPCLFL